MRNVQVGQSMEKERPIVIQPGVVVFSENMIQGYIPLFKTVTALKTINRLKRREQ